VGKTSARRKREADKAEASVWSVALEPRNLAKRSKGR